MLTTVAKSEKLQYLAINKYLYFKELEDKQICKDRHHILDKQCPLHATVKDSIESIKRRCKLIGKESFCVHT